MTEHPASTSHFGLLQLESLKYLHTYVQGWVRGRLWLQVVIGMVFGLVTGIALGPTVGWVDPATARDIGDWLALPGQLFLSLIQMIVIPLVIASIIRGLAASENVGQLRRTGSRVVVYFVLTTAIGVAIGVWLATAIEPGRYVDRAAVQAALAQAPAAPAAADTDPFDNLPGKIITLVPRNPLDAMLTSNMLQIVVFALILGVALVMMPAARARPLLEFLGSLLEVCMTIVRFAMWLAPLAVFGLLAQLTARIGLDALVGLAVYVATVLAGLALMLGLYLMIVLLGVRESPWRFLRNIREVLLLAFSTSSSAAVMPMSIKVCEEKLGVRPATAQFVIPLAATLNMNGTALYQGVAAIFLAQVYGVDVGLSGMVLVVVVAVGAAIGSPATPGVGIVILAMVLTSIGVPPAGIALIMGVDRLLDMSRTAINVAGDLTVCKLIDRWSGRNRATAEPPSGTG